MAILMVTWFILAHVMLLAVLKSASGEPIPPEGPQDTA